MPAPQTGGIPVLLDDCVDDATDADEEDTAEPPDPSTPTWLLPHPKRVARGSAKALVATLHEFTATLCCHVPPAHSSRKIGDQRPTLAPTPPPPPRPPFHTSSSA